jgi:putative tricarboxylic transport membrane protein
MVLDRGDVFKESLMQDADAWRPTREIELVAGTPPGGGQDRPARALIEVLSKRRLLDTPVKLTNIPGRGGGNAWDYLRTKDGDPHVLAINSPTIISNKLLGVSDLDYSDLTPLVNLYTEYPIFIVRSDSSITDLAELVRRLKADTAGVPIALATAIGNTNHIALAHLTRHAGGDVKALKIDVFDSARYAIARVVEGNAELGVITAVSAVPELTAGTLRTLALSGPQRLGGIFAGVPRLCDRGVDCKIGMWRGIIGARGIQPSAVAFWERTLAAATRADEWQAELAKKYWANTYTAGSAELAFLDEERALMTSALGELGLIRANQGAASA